MNPEHAAIIEQCTKLSLADQITFPEVVRRLAGVGVERYHADYVRQEKTYYLPDGDSLVVASPHSIQAIAHQFDTAAVQAAIAQSQRGQHGYADFVRKTMTAGCVGYFVQITGQRAIYFGRAGESHVERFPTAVD